MTAVSVAPSELTRPDTESDADTRLVPARPWVTLDQVGDYVLLLSRPQGKDWRRFWLPIEARLLHSSISSVA